MGGVGGRGGGGYKEGGYKELKLALLCMHTTEPETAENELSNCFLRVGTGN